jgi:hypothetical protein
MRVWLFTKVGKSCNTGTDVAGAVGLARFKESIAECSI